MDFTSQLSDNNGIKRIPFGYHRTLLYFLFIAYKQLCTIGDILRRQNDTGIDVDEVYFSQTTDNNLAGSAVVVDNVDRTHFFKLDAAVLLRND